MKKLIVLIILFITMGCAVQKFTIPDEPKYKAFTMQTAVDGVYIDHGSFDVLVENVGKMNAYAEKMREILIQLQKDK